MERTSSRPAERPRVRLRAALDHLPAEAALWAPSEASDDALCDAVRGAVGAVLSERQREIVEWHFFEGLSQGEIARRLGVSQQVVQKSLYGVVRGGRPIGGSLRRLREALSSLVRP
jgi:DNA-directed RNA polymerase specialized sigma24 family protein